MEASPSFEQLRGPRLIGPSEWKKFRDLRICMTKDAPQAFGDTLEVTLGRSEAEWRQWADGAYNFVFEADGRFVANVTFRQDVDGVWMVNGVWTDPAWRRLQLSKQLFGAVFSKARELGVSTIELSVNPKQAAAVKLYESLGFFFIEKNGGQVMGDGQVHEEHIMRIVLN